MYGGDDLCTYIIPIYRLVLDNGMHGRDDQ